MATFFYARVSTSDQTLEHQQAQAEDAGFKFDEVLSDHGISGVNVKLKDRPQGSRLMDKLRDGDTLVVRWIDRLGRNYQDVTDTIRDLMKRGVVVKTVINNMTFDGSTSDPMQEAIRDALIAFMAAMAQSQAEALKVAQKAGIDHARAKEDKYRGRKPSYNKEQLEMVQNLLANGDSPSSIAKTVGLSRQAIYRIRDNPTSATRTLELWSA